MLTGRYVRDFFRAIVFHYFIFITMKKTVEVCVANSMHLPYASDISSMIERATRKKDSGLAKRSSEYINEKITTGKAIIALDGKRAVGFCYIECWGHERFVANSGLIVDPDYRGLGLAKRIKKAAFDLSRKKFPNAKLFGLTTSLAVMKINSSLGYKPVTFTELTDDVQFWRGCESCANYDILVRTNRVHCLCTGMLYDPKMEEPKKTKAGKSWKVYGRWLRYKRHVFFKKFRKNGDLKRLEF